MRAGSLLPVFLLLYMNPLWVQAQTALYRINCGGSAYTDSQGNAWSADSGYNTGGAYSTGSAIQGTPDPVLYQSERYDLSPAPELVYSLAVPPGSYEVRLHFANIYAGTSGVGQRVFDVEIEGQLVLDNFDIIAEAGDLTALVRELDVAVDDGALNISFFHVVENPKINAIEVLDALPSSVLTTDPNELFWGHVGLGNSGGTQQIMLTNTGSEDITISKLDFDLITGVGHDFIVTLDDANYVGDHEDISYNISVPIPVGQDLIVPVDFVPTEPSDNSVSLTFWGNFPKRSVLLTGVGGEDTGDPFLHVVIDAPEVVVDYENIRMDYQVFGILADHWLTSGCGACGDVDFDLNGSVDLNDVLLLASFWFEGIEPVFLQGSFSHTHEPGHSLTAFEWSREGQPFSTLPDVTAVFPTGDHTVSLTITDDNDPPRILMDSKTFTVAPVNQVPGSLVRYYRAGGGSPADLLDTIPSAADYARQLTKLELQTAAIATNVMIRFSALLDILVDDTYAFDMTGGFDGRILIDDAEPNNPLFLSAGLHLLDARFAVNSSAELPLQVTMAQGGGGFLPIDEGMIYHDLSSVPPVINTFNPTEGFEGGGNAVQMTGLGFFPDDDVAVHWGPQLLVEPNIAVTPEVIDLNSPPGTGLVTVGVETSRGMSNTFQYAYSAEGPLPIVFNVRDLQTGITSPTTLAMGPDGRLYVATQYGQIRALTLDDNYNVIDTQVIGTIGSLSNPNILGIAFNPFDPPDPVRLYVSHGLLFANGGDCFTGTSPYSGQISVLEGPDFTTVEPLITGLPVSNHDHGVNGIEFDHNGDLYVAIGGNTNAGVPACPIGGLPESPLSAAILKASISKPFFNGDIVYWEIGSNPPVENDDQVFGDTVRVADGVDVSVYAPGLRNSYDLTLTTQNLLYATDNGPNTGFGAASTGPDTQGPDPFFSDEFCLVEFNQYYGHPNRTRGAYDSRQNIYHDNTEAPVPHEFTQSLTNLASSTNGLVEYRAATFNSAMRGDVLTQKLNSITLRMILTSDGRDVTSKVSLPVSLQSLDITTGPGGVIFGAAHAANKVVIAEPVETVGGLRLYDIFPWRAPESGGYPFTLGGKEFGTLATTSVTIGGQPAVLTSVSPTRIRGVIPAHPDSTRDLLDVVVTVGAQSRVLPKAFRYLKPAGNEPYGWRFGPDLSVALGETAGGIINDVLYVVGEGNDNTLAYDLAAGTWNSPGSLSQRPFPGHHHPAVVFDGKLYLMGGLSDGAEGKIQIYDPNTDNWTLGTDMPWAAGAGNAVLIGNEIYVCGGIVGSSTVTDCARYNPVTDSWTTLASMPAGRNHAGHATDGQRLYIFGGRGPGSGDGNVVANGFSNVQIYDPQTDTWESSDDSGSTLAPLPQARGGMGQSLFYRGEFYVMGGETSSGAGATPVKTYDRTDIYNPQTNTWRDGPPMPVGEHGICPVLHDDQIYLGGGGVIAGFSQSTNFLIYAPY